jgi:hypothetical protein
MISQLEFSSRAALCRKLAKQEPTNRALWMAEAEKWLRLERETSRRGKGQKFRRLGEFVSRSKRENRGSQNACLIRLS